MQLQIDPTRVHNRNPCPVLVVAASALAVITFALLTGVLAPSTDVTPTPLARATGPSPPPATAPDLTAGFRVAQLPPPDAIDCHDLAPAACAAVALAAVGRLTADDPVATSIDAWSSLLCSDEQDCPRARLTRNRPLGSAVVTTGSGATLWVNVLQPPPAADASGTPRRTIAWVIHWQP